MKFPILSCATILTLALGALNAVYAGSATWNNNPTSGDWNNAANWMPATVPNGAHDTATFDVSNVTDVSVQASDILKGMTFHPLASPFTISIGGSVAVGSLTLGSAGIVNNSGTTQNLLIAGLSTDLQASLTFIGTATAGNGTVITNNPYGTTTFADSSSAGGATFINQSKGGLGMTVFRDNSTAANGIFTNEAGDGTFGGQINFEDDSTAGAGFFTNKGQSLSRGIGGVISFDLNARAGTATFINEANSHGAGASMQFAGNSSADHGIFTFEGGTIGNSSNASGVFVDNATADEAVITLEPTLSNLNAGGSLSFLDSSTAGNSTLIAEGGTIGDSGGTISFQGDSQGGTAQAELLGPACCGGTLAIDAHNPSGVTIGSVDGAGIIVLGANNLTVGTNNLSTTFSGLIEGGQGGSLTKVGTGTFTLIGSSSVDTYTGGSTVSGGTLIVTNRLYSPTGTGPVQVNAGTLGGTGKIGGAVTVGTGSGTGAFLAPAAGMTVQATLIIHSALTLNADATYTCTFRAKPNKAKSDQVVANGITINSGAMIALSGQTMRVLPQGLVMTLIHNTSANPITGTFINLSDGSIVTINGNNFQASYEGGDGNDLTLTVVP